MSNVYLASERDVADAFSMDWRFLPSIPVGGNALIVYADQPDAVTGLTANFDLVIVLSDSNRQATETRSVALPEPVFQVSTQMGTLPFQSATFDLVAFPDGVPELVDLRRLRRLLAPGGVLYMGFPNRWSFLRLRPKTPRPDRQMSLRQARRSLEQSGFSIEGVYGAISNHRVPRFLFPLQTDAVYFAVKNYLRKKNKRVYAAFPPFLTRWIFWTLPAYCIVASNK